jgi:hypothetical protein
MRTNHIHIYLPMKMEQSVPKRRHIKSRRRGTTEKKACNIQNTAKAWNQEHIQEYFKSGKPEYNLFHEVVIAYEQLIR